MDRTRQAMFNVVGGRVVQASVLDLFAGGGSLGIEAMSRGAASCTFVERSREALRYLRRNAAGLEGVEVVHGDVRRVLARLDGRRFDLILLDPPYGCGWLKQTLSLCRQHGLLGDGGWMIVEHSCREELEATMDWAVLRVVQCGDSRITVLGRRE